MFSKRKREARAASKAKATTKAASVTVKAPSAAKLETVTNVTYTLGVNEAALVRAINAAGGSSDAVRDAVILGRLMVTEYKKHPDVTTDEMRRYALAIMAARHPDTKNAKDGEEVRTVAQHNAYNAAKTWYSRFLSNHGIPSHYAHAASAQEAAKVAADARKAKSSRGTKSATIKASKRAGKAILAGDIPAAPTLKPEMVGTYLSRMGAMLRAIHDKNAKALTIDQRNALEVAYKALEAMAPNTKLATPAS